MIKMLWHRFILRHKYTQGPWVVPGEKQAWYPTLRTCECGVMWAWG